MAINVVFVNTANIVPAIITALIQNIQELMVPVSGLEQVKKNMSLPPVWVKQKGH